MDKKTFLEQPYVKTALAKIIERKGWETTVEEWISFVNKTPTTSNNKVNGFNTEYAIIKNGNFLGSDLNIISEPNGIADEKNAQKIIKEVFETIRDDLLVFTKKEQLPGSLPTQAHIEAFNAEAKSKKSIFRELTTAFLKLPATPEAKKKSLMNSDVISGRMIMSYGDTLFEKSILYPIIGDSMDVECVLAPVVITTNSKGRYYAHEYDSYTSADYSAIVSKNKIWISADCTSPKYNVADGIGTKTYNNDSKTSLQSINDHWDNGCGDKGDFSLTIDKTQEIYKNLDEEQEILYKVENVNGNIIVQVNKGLINSLINFDSLIENKDFFKDFENFFKRKCEDIHPNAKITFNYQHCKNLSSSRAQQLN
ncbi:MAG: hypothetical protein ACRC4M_04715 [Mycoplasma sp.]